MHYQPAVDDSLFIAFEVLYAHQQLARVPAFAEVDQALMTQVLNEAGKFVADVVAPLQVVGDSIGCRFDQGQVITPPGFRSAYQAFWQAGWPALSSAPEDGGQGLPTLLEAVLYEMLSAANHGWTMAPGLLHGAYECLKHHASDDLKARYLSKLATGEWLATMCLTEPHAGSDLGLARTRATAQEDGSYRLSGTKIFISGGEHDLSDNIVHLVLARLPDAPAGPKGLTLFLVPKFMPDGSRSAVHCERIEEKMGLHGSPTCVMRFEEATCSIVGEPGRGLGAMFVMMNAARLHVALQGIGLLEAAWQKAQAYSLERRQMRAPGRGKSADAADYIADHPAIRRILDTQRAWIDGGRVLAYRTAIELDRAHHLAADDPAAAAQAQRWASLVTPVLKSAWTEQGFIGASACLQVLGGHGYVREWGIEQIVRDARVAMIYEGTNEIQGIDLLVRKVLVDGGQALGAMLADLATQWPADHAGHDRIRRLNAVTHRLVQAAPGDAALAFEVADDYLRAVALVLLDWAWACIEVAPGARVPRWQAPRQALARHVLPEFDMRLQIIETRCASAHESVGTRCPS